MPAKLSTTRPVRSPGTRRDEIRPGPRTTGFERRATIAFQVKRAEVAIVRIFYGGRDYERALPGAAEE